MRRHPSLRRRCLAGCAVASAIHDGPPPSTTGKLGGNTSPDVIPAVATVAFGDRARRERGTLQQAPSREHSRGAVTRRRHPGRNRRHTRRRRLARRRVRVRLRVRLRLRGRVRGEDEAAGLRPVIARRRYTRAVRAREDSGRASGADQTVRSGWRGTYSGRHSTITSSNRTPPRTSKPKWSNDVSRARSSTVIVVEPKETPSSQALSVNCEPLRA